MSGWFLLASANVQCEPIPKLFNQIKVICLLIFRIFQTHFRGVMKYGFLKIFHNPIKSKTIFREHIGKYQNS